MAPEPVQFNNLALFRKLWTEADTTSTVFLGLDTIFTKKEQQISELGLAACCKGAAQALEVHHFVIQAQLKNVSVPLAARFGQSIHLTTHAELISELNKVIQRLSNTFERVVVTGFAIAGDFSHLRRISGWELADCLLPNTVKNIDVIDIQWLAQAGLLLETTSGWKLEAVTLALGVVLGDVKLHNAAHNGWVTNQCLFIQGDLLTGALSWASPTFTKPTQTRSKKRKREDDSDEEYQHENGLQNEGGQHQLLTNNIFPADAMAAPVMGSNNAPSIPAATSTSATRKPLIHQPNPFPIHQSQTATNRQRIPDDALRLVDLLTDRHARESQLQREFHGRENQHQRDLQARQQKELIEAMHQKQACDSQQQKELIDVINGRMATIAEKLVELLSNGSSRSARRSSEEDER